VENCLVKRAEFIENISSYPQHKIYYIDECGIDTYLYREYAHAPRGQKVMGIVSGKKFKRTNIVAARRGGNSSNGGNSGNSNGNSSNGGNSGNGSNGSNGGGNIVAPIIYDGTTDSIFFEHWFDHELLPAIPKGSCCVMDNATFHRKNELYGLAAKAGCTVIFLPPYSPDLNPIEKYWSWLKRQLRKVLPDYDNFMDALVGCFEVK